MPVGRSRLAYSTEQVTPRPGIYRKRKPDEKVLKATMRPAQQRVTIRLDRKARGGKSVTVIEGLRMAQEDRVALLKQLKAWRGTGGTVKGTSLEIQGDHCDAVMEALEKMGYRPKRSGG